MPNGLNNHKTGTLAQERFPYRNLSEMGVPSYGKVNRVDNG